jgi:hypothetical protein
VAQVYDALPLHYMAINIYYSLFDIPSGGASGPRGNIGFLKLFRRGHVAHIGLISPSCLFFI